MSRTVILASILALALNSSVAVALGIGGLSTQSALNQPFVGEIELFDVRPDQLDTVKASIAPAEAFEKAGVERYHFLTGLSFAPQVSSRGAPVIQVSSREPIREPFLDFLVEVVWPTGRVVRAFTVLLDPPATTTRGAPAVTPPAVTGPARVERPATPPSPSVPPPASSTREAAPPRPTAPARAPVAPGPDGFPMSVGPVRPGGGLLRLARGVADPGATLEQAALALYRNNQDAFIGGDINRLRVGQTLIIPSRAELLALDPADAERELAAALRGEAVRRAPLTDSAMPEVAEATEGRLRIAGAAAPGPVEPVPGVIDESLPSPEPPSAGRDLEQELLLVMEANESARQETDELRKRVRELETQLADLQALVLLRTSEIGQVPETADGTPEPAAPDATADSEASDASVGEEGAPTPEGATTPPEAPETPAETPVVTAPPPVTAPAVESTPSEPSTWSAYLLPLAAFAGVTALGVLGFSWLAARRKRREQAEEDSLGPLELVGTDEIQMSADRAPARESTAGTGARPSATPTATAPREAPPSEPPSRARVEPESEPLRETAAVPPPLETAEEPEASMTIDSKDLAALADLDSEADEADAVAEADIYMAYGRYPEAADLLKRELARAPQRQDVRFKLADVYVGLEDAAGLESTLEALGAAGGARIDPEHWRRLEAIREAVRQGRGWSPEASATAGEAAAAAPQVPASNAAPAARPAAGLGRLAVPAAGVGASNEPLLIDLDDLDLSEDLALEGPRPTRVEARDDGLSDLVRATEDLPILLDDSLLLEISPKPEPTDTAETVQSRAPGDSDGIASVEPEPRAPATLPDEELILRLPDEVPSPNGSAISSPSATEGGEIDLDALAASGADRLAEAGDLVLTLDDLHDDELDLSAFFESAQESPPAEPPETPPQPAGPARATSVDLSLPDLELPDVLKGLAIDSVELPAQAGSAGDAGQAGGEEDWAVDSSIWDENATKLDLARAYLEMSDVDAAREILTEVIAEGREGQRREARELLSTLD